MTNRDAEAIIRVGGGRVKRNGKRQEGATRMVRVKRVPGVRLIIILLGVFFVLWMPFEGDLRLVVGLGVWTALTVTALAARRLLTGRWLRAWQFTLVAFGLGTILGFTAPLFTLLFMALKTGLHGHGPEFTLAEIRWVQRQLLLWFSVGGLLGLGSGLIYLGRLPAGNPTADR